MAIDDDDQENGSLNRMMPIRFILWLGERLPFARDLDFDDGFSVAFDAVLRKATVSFSGALGLDVASFGSQLPVKSRIARVTTTNATPAVLAVTDDADAFLVASNEAADLIGTLIGKKRSSPDIYRADVRGTIANNLPTSAPLTGDAVTSVNSGGALAAASVAITTDAAGSFVVTVTGVAATTIDWTFAFQVQTTGVIV